MSMQFSRFSPLQSLFKYCCQQFIILNMMRSLRTRKTLLDGLSPWEAKPAEEEENQMNQFCHRALPTLKPEKSLSEKVNEQFHQLNFNAPQIKIRTRRPFSNVQSTRDGEERRTIFDRLSANHNRELKSAQKPSQPELKLEGNPLQEISVRNYVIEGSRDFPRESVIRKKQSSYVMKQKFAEIRRSMNLQLGIWGCVNKGREPRCENKENLILRHLRYG